MNTKIEQKLPVKSFIARKLPKFFGIEYVECSPIVAGGLSKRNDAAGNKLSFSSPPPSTIFYNLTTDKEILKTVQDVKFNYVIGESDAGAQDNTRIDDKSLIYWKTLQDSSSLDYGDAVLVRMVDISNDDDYGNNVHPDWMCLRRIGDEHGSTQNKDTKDFFVRSVVNGNILTKSISRELIQGKVFGRYNIKASKGVVAVSG